MASIKSTRSIIAFIIVFIIGLTIGVLVNDIPFVSFKHEVDLGTLISVLGLVATILIMPFVVQRYLNKEDSINEVILTDLETIYRSVNELKDIYVSLSPRSKISKTKYIQILALFKTVSMEILALNTQLQKRSRLDNFKKDVYDDAYTPSWETCTEHIIINKSLDEKAILEANKSLCNLCTTLQTYRYETYM